MDGAASALELHIVHKLHNLFVNKDTYAVVGILFDVDDNSVGNLFDQIDFTTTQTKNFGLLLSPYLLPYPLLHYKGSFTTPNCDEIVNWFVVERKFSIRSSQLLNIAAAINSN